MVLVIRNSFLERHVPGWRRGSAPDLENAPVKMSTTVVQAISGIQQAQLLPWIIYGTQHRHLSIHNTWKISE
jgi:hypothetical protein